MKKTNNNEAVVKTLNNLIETNLDRIKGYETAAKDAEDNDLKNLCNEYIEQSRNFKNELERLVTQYGGKPTTTSSASGAVYPAWMNVKATLRGNDKKAIYSLCEFGEDAAKKSYAEAKEDVAALPNDVIMVINKQESEILKAHDRVKSLRDSLVEQAH